VTELNIKQMMSLSGRAQVLMQELVTYHSRLRDLLLKAFGWVGWVALVVRKTPFSGSMSSKT
jgi:hypothetical protein